MVSLRACGLASVLTLSACSLFVGSDGNGEGDGGADSGADASANQTRRSITIEGPVSGELSDFPLMVRLRGDADLQSPGLTGAQIGFETVGGEPLAHHIELFDPEAGNLTAWVRLPSLSTGTQLFLVIGPDPPASSEPVFVPEQFEAVLHLGDGTTARPFPDSTGNGHDGQSQGKMQPEVIDLDVGSGRAVDFGAGDEIAVADPDERLSFGAASFSYAVWVRLGVTDPSPQMPFYRGGAAGSDAGYDIALTNTGWRALLSDGTTRFEAEFGNDDLHEGNFTQLVAVVNRETDEFHSYANGVRVDTTEIPSLGDVNVVKTLQLSRSDVDPFFGILDEVRVYSIAVSPEQVAAEYANVIAPDEFYSVSAPGE